MKTRFVHYLYFSRNERLGAVALLALCVAVFLTPMVRDWLRPRETTDFSELKAAMLAFRQAEKPQATLASSNFDFDPNLASAEALLQLGLSEKVVQNICKFREKGGQFRQPEDFKKIWSLNALDFERLKPYIRISVAKNGAQQPGKVPDPFPFDPNTATEADFLRLGLNARTTSSILHFRERGGVFRKKEDFAKIYTLSPEDFERLEPFVTIPPAAGSGGLYGSSKPKLAGPVDVNRATVENWMSLPLIGEKRAQQIIAFREKLGGFRSVEQVAEMFGMPDSVYQRIKPHLVWSAAGIRKINLNTITLEALDAHPYISKKQADLIIAYRNQHGDFARADDVLNIKAFTDPLWWERVSPYLDVQ